MTRVVLFAAALLTPLIALSEQTPVVALVGGTIINPGPSVSRSVGTILVEAGLSTAAALHAATIAAAQMIGAGKELGLIAPGYHADLVVLDADPLADIRNVRRISRVMKAGILR